MLRPRGVKVSGRKGELVGRLLDGDAKGFDSASVEHPKVESQPSVTAIKSVHSKSIPLDGIVIEAGKS